MKPQAETGITLVELLISLAVLALLLGWGAPNLVELQARARAKSQIDDLYQDLRGARELAITYVNSVTVCPLDSNNRCHNDWHSGYRVFIDTSPFGEFSSDDELIFERGKIATGDFISSTEKMFRFTTDGFTSDAGNIRYCPRSVDSNHRQQLTISTTGGVRYNDTPNQC
ncbi:GspH/FimT family pseudopilin [Ferrimonas senticii]|uniref:GspH/FimT family pseudopilin n=1 Tax=Ferrimonas senticii TaxID=394566 RepID=UPI000429EA38|nr:GspH/FimT family pseudopilin [Ferrimonas senticii]